MRPYSQHRRGQSLAEYALILGLVAVVVIGIAFGVGLADQRIFGLVAGRSAQNTIRKPRT